MHCSVCISTQCNMFYQIKSNQILFIWHLSYFKSNTKCLTEAKNNNDKTYQPSHHHKYPERHRDIQTQTHTYPHTHTCTRTHAHKRTHTCTHKHTSSDPLHLLDRDMARHRDLSQGKSHPWGQTTLRGLPAHDYRERHRDSHDPGRQAAPHQGAEPSSHPGQSSPQDSTPVSGTKAAPNVVGPHEETLELKTERLKQ